MTQIFYYLILYPLSLLPLKVLFVFSDLFFFISYHLLAYRKKVIMGNLKNSFPEKSHQELKSIAKEFYKYFCDFVFESIKCFSISEKKVLERCKFKNPEIINDLYAKNKSVILVCGHYNNWEMAASAFTNYVQHDAVGIYRPLNNQFFDRKFKESRARYGGNMLSKYIVKDYLKENAHKNILIGFVSDQCPKKSNNNLFWTRFLNQDTAVMFGAEKYAVDFDLAVAFMNITRVKRGCYELSVQMISENPKDEKYGFITKKHTELLEKEIISEPAYWLWTHKRWKFKRNQNECIY